MENKVTEITAENAETTALIVRDFELTTPEKPMTEAELLNYLADVIAYMIEKRLDYLLSLLYRLDVAEDNINRRAVNIRQARGMVIQDEICGNLLRCGVTDNNLGAA